MVLLSNSVMNHKTPLCGCSEINITKSKIRVMIGGTFKNGSNSIITCFKTNQNIEKLRVCFLNNF